MKKKILFVILDGAGDGLRPGTTLERAFKPVLDSFTKNGFAGLIENKLLDHPDSGVSIFNLFGYKKDDYPGRGYLDAMGIGLPQLKDTVYMRGNYATVEEIVAEKAENQYETRLKLVDRRAGRDTNGLREITQDIKEINIEGIKVKLFKSVAHRCVLMISNIDISPNVSDSNCQVGEIVPKIKPLDNDTASIRTASILNKWSDEVYKIMKSHSANKYRKIPANYILLRGASIWKLEKPFEEKFSLKGAVIAASPVVRGIGRHLEMGVIDVSGATGDKNTNLKNKVLAALDALHSYDYVVLHILSPDIYAHDKDINGKIANIEKIDREVFARIKEYVDFSKTILVVTSDHVTNPENGMHEPGMFPFVIYTLGINPNNVEKYAEEACKLGPVIQIEDFMEQLIEYI
ncbi:MAG: hypothetical protein J7K26_03150 [Candidatus Aenigmarchaeota archaeon]|nr:hypothetical protein [Candidatus Aenigmarchaeota archaeon]